MKMLKKLSVFTMSAVLVVMLSACGKADHAKNTAQGNSDAQMEESFGENTIDELSTREFAPSEAYVRAIGRTGEQDDTLWLVQSGSGAEFTFTGTAASVTIKPDSMLNSGMDSQARIAIYVNGERVVDDMVNKLEKTYAVFESETPQRCTVRVIKLSEAAQSTVGIAGIEVTSVGDIAPTQQKERFIEFIGDSITCGYGVDDENRDHHFSTRTEDVTKTYAYQAAELLDADYSMVSYSGYGIISGYSGNGEPVPEQTLPQYYDKLGFSYGAYMGLYYPQDVAWDFTKRQPDIIVINLGTNDNSYVRGNAEKETQYEAAYTEFIEQVRTHNPEAVILCTLGIMGDELYPSIERAVSYYQEKTGDTNVYTMRFDVQSPDDGYAADWHPTQTTHTKAAQRLAEEIEMIMEW